MADDSSEMNNLSAEMYEMIEFAAQTEGVDIMLDLRARGNNANSTHFDAFFEAAQQYLVINGFTAVDHARHGQIPHLAAAPGGQQGATRMQKFLVKLKT